ncbi:hypothetical protein NDU88_007183 [Pleurodeles waltl]|uniref:Uncharacterized protein n=1 Tax=Pleurodeles waltl TaxID=8319 RepID=A0AAV7MFB6_PLEWA|nr:hypothetical protein NDU88_007183 [Pleurodeles waltl]
MRHQHRQPALASDPCRGHLTDPLSQTCSRGPAAEALQQRPCSRGPAAEDLQQRAAEALQQRPCSRGPAAEDLQQRSGRLREPRAAPSATTCLKETPSAPGTQATLPGKGRAALTAHIPGCPGMTAAVVSAIVRMDPPDQQDRAPPADTGNRRGKMAERHCA